MLFLVEAQLLLKILKNQPRLLLACCLIISTCKCVHMIGYTVWDVYVLENKDGDEDDEGDSFSQGG